MIAEELIHRPPPLPTCSRHACGCMSQREELHCGSRSTTSTRLCSYAARHAATFTVEAVFPTPPLKLMNEMQTAIAPRTLAKSPESVAGKIKTKPSLLPPESARSLSHYGGGACPWLANHCRRNDKSPASLSRPVTRFMRQSNAGEANGICTPASSRQTISLEASS